MTTGRVSRLRAPVQYFPATSLHCESCGILRVLACEWPRDAATTAAGTAALLFADGGSQFGDNFL
jgi:hypothetical protein